MSRKCIKSDVSQYSSCLSISNAFLVTYGNDCALLIMWSLGFEWRIKHDMSFIH